jgi:hypothetical protein
LKLGKEIFNEKHQIYAMQLALVIKEALSYKIFNGTEPAINRALLVKI